MKFTQFDIENFLAIGKATLTLSDRGLVVIQGENADNTSAESNGSGKSSLPDALCWCLYGVTARGESGDDIINDVAAKNCRVAVGIQDDLTTWRVERHRKHKTYKNTLRLIQIDPMTGAETDFTKGTDKLTQIEVDKVVGCSYEVFRSAVYAGQEQMPNLPAMTDKQLKMLVEEAAGVTVLEAAYKEANLRLATAKQTAEQAKTKIETTAAAILRQKQQIATTTLNHADFEKKRAADGLSLKIEAQKILESIKTLDAAIAKIDIQKIMGDIAVVESRINGIKHEQARERSLQAKVQKASQDAIVAAQDYKSWKALVDKAQQEINAVESRVGSPCGECGKPYCDHDVAGARAIAISKHDAQLAGLPQRETALRIASQGLKDAQGQLAAHQSSMTDITAETRALNDLNAVVMDHSSKQAQRKAMVDMARDKMELWKKKAQEANPFDQVMVTLEADLRILETVEKQDQAVYEAALDAVKRAEAVSKVFSPAGVRALILDEVTPFLNGQTAKYLGTLTDGNTTATWTTLVKNAKGEMREKFSIDVEDVQGGKKFGLLSGGEKRKVRVAASLALQDLVARRATKPIDLFVGDEIDDALDTPGLERLTSILDEKAKERGTVLVISHNNLTDWISNTILVSKKNRVATVTESVQ